MVKSPKRVKRLTVENLTFDHDILITYFIRHSVFKLVTGFDLAAFIAW